MQRFLLTATALILFSLRANAVVKLPDIFSDHMVLQQKTETAIWGTADPGSRVVIKTGWNHKRTVIWSNPENGEWFARIATPAAGGPYEISVSGNGCRTTLHDVMIGEVWYCSGQSNMEMPMKGYPGQPVIGSTDIIISARPDTPIRICSVSEDCGSWATNTPEAVSETSATAYFFALKLQQTLDIPIGLIICARGGSAIDAWLDAQTMQAFESEYPRVRPNYLYDGLVRKLVPFTFRGMLWYQGEANMDTPELYSRMQTAYVQMMRRVFEADEAPFYFVQMAPHAFGDPDGWIRGAFGEAQEKSLANIGHSGMAVTLDAGELETVHSANKRVPGERLALLALRNTYGHSGINAEGPVFESLSIERDKALVRFRTDEEGLVLSGQELSGFEVSGADHIFHPATGHIMQDRRTVELSCPEVSEPVAVRYCFRNWCECSVYGISGIPAAPFRTDGYPL